MRLPTIFATFAGLLAFASPIVLAEKPNLSDVLGVVHMTGRYYFGQEDYLNQGADAVLATGSKVIKLAMGPRTASKYAWNSNWPDMSSLTDIARTSYFKSVLSKPFHTFIITAYTPNIPGAPSGRMENYWLKGVTPQQAQYETDSFHALAAYLMQTYNGTGKTFILEQWEGDWALRQDGPDMHKTKPTPANVKGMTDWINARQAGILKARAEFGSASDVKVYGCLEVNRVAEAINPNSGVATVANDVLPNTSVDFASYSAYDTMGFTSGSASFASAVQWIADHLPPTAIHGKSAQSVYVGEFGIPEGMKSPAQVNAVMDNVIDTVIADRMPYCCYWEIYCNELRTGAPAPPENGNNSAVKGFYLIRPDGTPATAWHQYRRRIITSDPARTDSAAIMKGLKLLYSSTFPNSGGLGKGWSTDLFRGNSTVTASNGTVRIQIVKNPADHPSGSAKLAIADAAGRPMQPGDFFQCTLQRRNDAGGIGVQLFGSSNCSGDGPGPQPFEVWSDNAWTPVSFALDGSHPAFDWDKPNILGLRLDTADGTFATVSYYLNGSYIGSWLYPTAERNLNLIELFAQSGVQDAAFDFADVRIYSAK